MNSFLMRENKRVLNIVKIDLDVGVIRVNFAGLNGSWITNFHLQVFLEDQGVVEEITYFFSKSKV